MSKLRLKTAVLIVGGGPVGLTLALDLAWRGIEVIVAEMRPAGEPPSPKCNHVAPPSMETFRRLGFVQRIRCAGLPADWPNDVCFRTSFTGIEFARIPIPSRAERYTAKWALDSDWPTPEPPHRINQIYLEPVLFQEAVSAPQIRLLNCMRVDGVRQNDRGVVAKAVNLDDSSQVEITAAYLVGCDGGRSTVRKLIGASLSGNPDRGPGRTSAFLHAPELRGLYGKPAWSSHSVNRTQSGSVTAIDGRDLWLVRWPIRDGASDSARAERDRRIRDILGVPDNFPYRILHEEFWKDSRLVCDHIRNGRLFLAGDAAHLWPATGGFGMNAGICDAVDLAWMLAAVLKGWAPQTLLDAYEMERLPVTHQVSRFVKGHSSESRNRRAAIPEAIADAGLTGEAARRDYGQLLIELNNRQYFVGGLNFGYFYDRSPVIAYDGAEQPPYTMDRFTPSTVPGCRVPHSFLKDGRSLFDALGPDFSLLQCDRSAEVDGFARAAARIGLPLKFVPLDEAEQYDRRLILVRPDGHIAWRGDTEPENVEALLDLVRGVSTARSLKPRHAEEETNGPKN